MTRPEKVEELMRAANDGMLTAARDASAGEVISAFVTMAANALQASKEAGAPIEVLRGAVEQIMLRLDDPHGSVM